MTTNNVVLIGRMTKEAELKFIGNGTATASFTLAVDRSFKDANGDKGTDFINCVVWRKQAEALANYTKKGSKLSVRGRIQVRNYDNSEGKKVYITEVVVEEFTFLDSKSDNSEPTYKKEPVKKMIDDDPFDRTNGQPIDISDDDLPF